MQGLDVKVIEEKNEEIRKRMMEMMPKNFGSSGPFPAMNVNFDSKTGQFKIEPMDSEKNEV